MNVQFLNSTSCVMSIRKVYAMLVSNLLELKLTQASEERSRANVVRQINNLEVSKVFKNKLYLAEREM